MQGQAVAATLRKIAGVAIALGLAASPRVAAAAIGPATAEASAAAPVDFRAEQDVLDPDWHRDLVQQEAATALAAEDPLGPEDRIEITLGGVTLAYRITVTPLHRGEAVGGTPKVVACECSSTVLATRVGPLVAEAARTLHAARREREERLAAQTERERQQAEEEQRVEQRRLEREQKRNALAARRYRPERLGFFGALGIGLGGASIATGAVLVGRGDGRRFIAELHPRDLRPPGYALIGAGAAVLSAGVTMLVIDVLRCKRDRVLCGGREGPFAWRAGPRLGSR